MSSDAMLTSTGWVDWPTVQNLLGKDPCLWTDLGGLHALQPAPTRLPIGATHLWSWRPDRWIRVRLDTNRALATILAPCSDSYSGTGEPVTYTKTAGIAWEGHERATACHFTVELLRTQGRAPITFIAHCVRSAQEHDDAPN